MSTYIESPKMPPKWQGAAAEDKKAASPLKKNKGEIEASPAKIIKDKKEKKLSYNPQALWTIVLC